MNLHETVLACNTPSFNQCLMLRRYPDLWRRQLLPAIYSFLDLDQNQQFVRIGCTYQADNQSEMIPPETNPYQWNYSVIIYIEEWDSINPMKTLYFNYAPEISKNAGWFPQDFSRVYLGPG